MNTATLSGLIPSAPTSRDLPSGSMRLSFDITTELGTVPVVVIDPTPSISHRTHAAHTDQLAVTVVGHIARRFFRHGGQTVSRVEVVADAPPRLATFAEATSAAGE